MSFIFTVLRKTHYLIFALTFFISGVVSSPVQVVKGDLTPAGQFDYVYTEGAALCQGIACDGEYFYCTGCIKPLDYNALVKINASTGEIVSIKDMCIPADLMLKGYSHFGDCSYYGGKIYIACEAFFFINPAVMVYSADTLEFEACHVLPEEGRGNGHIPWVCVKGDTVYYSQARQVTEIRMLNLSDFSYKGAVKTDKEITKITGGDIYNGLLYLPSNDGSDKKVTYTVDLSSGHVEEALIRDMGNVFTEAEGIDITPLDDGSLFHFTDTTAFCRTMIRSYSAG